MPENSVKRCAIQLSSALDYMQKKGLVHRDIKPENILIFDKECRQVKLTDFGLSCRNGTPVESMPENLPYTAPEMCCLGASEKLIAHTNLDTWSFGVLLFSTLTGYFPWTSAVTSDNHYIEYSKWQRSKRIFRVPNQWKIISGEAIEMLTKLIVPDPIKRSSCTDVLKYLKAPWKVTLDNSKTTKSNVFKNKNVAWR